MCFSFPSSGTLHLAATETRSFPHVHQFLSNSIDLRREEKCSQTIHFLVDFALQNDPNIVKVGKTVVAWFFKYLLHEDNAPVYNLLTQTGNSCMRPSTFLTWSCWLWLILIPKIKWALKGKWWQTVWKQWKWKPRSSQRDWKNCLHDYWE